MFRTPLDDLTLMTLQAILDRMDWTEPYCEFGFLTALRREIIQAAERKTISLHEQWRKQNG